MKKIIAYIFVIVGIIFIAGCLGGEKTSTSGGILLNPSSLLNGYYSSNFQSYAIPEVESYEVRPGFIEFSSSSMKQFENEIPAGNKRVMTRFKLVNEDNTIQIWATIYESDSDSKLKEFIDTEMEKLNPDEQNLTRRGSVGDYSIQKSFTEGDGRITSSIFLFSVENKVVDLVADSEVKGASVEQIQAETLKVAEAIKSKI